MYILLLLILYFRAAKPLWQGLSNCKLFNDFKAAWCNHAIELPRVDASVMPDIPIRFQDHSVGIYLRYYDTAVVDVRTDCIRALSKAFRHVRAICKTDNAICRTIPRLGLPSIKTIGQDARQISFERCVIQDRLGCHARASPRKPRAVSIASASPTPSSPLRAARRML